MSIPEGKIAGPFGLSSVRVRLFSRGDDSPPGRKNLMAAKKAAKKPAAKKTARKPNAAFMKAMTPSAALAKIVGDKPLPRTEVVKKLWAYVKKNNLQDKKEKRNINADDQLREVFGGKKTVSMFEMTKLVNDNLS
jgi:upstream activation factor subunit UAF30